MFSLSLSLTLSLLFVLVPVRFVRIIYYSYPAQSPIEEYENSHNSNESYALVVIVGIYGVDSPFSASKAQS